MLSASIVLLVSVCVPVRVATVPSIAKVTLLPDAVDVIPVPPNNPKDSLSRSILIELLPSVKSRSCAVTCESTYALIDCWVANAVFESEPKLSSSNIVVTVWPLLKLKLVTPFTVPPFISTVLSDVIDIGNVTQPLLDEFLIFNKLLEVSTQIW